MDEKAQGALEYLLLIGGAVLVAVVVIAIITGMSNNSEVGTHGNTAINKINDDLETKVSGLP